MEAWGEGRVVLFEALSAICTRVGEESAADLASGIKQSSGQDFGEQLRELKNKASQVDGLQSENLRLRAELAAALQRQQNEQQHPEAASGAHHAESKTTQTDPSLDMSDRYEALVTKYNALFTNHRQMSSARQELETKLRKTRTERQNWINYANSLTKRVQKLESKLANHNLLHTGSFKSETADEPEQVNTSPIRSVESKVVEINVGIQTPSGHRLSHSPRSSEFEGDTFVGTPEDAAFDILQGKGRLEFGGDHHDTSRNSTSPAHENNAVVESSKQRTVLNDTLLLPAFNNHTTQYGSDQEILDSSPPQRSSSTQGDPEDGVPSEGPRSPTRDQLTSPIIKHESPSDIPVVIFSRSVRKRQKGTTTPQKVRIKIEKITSSPLRIGSSQHNDSPQSLDLDDVGEKVRTPRKRKRSASNKQSNIASSHNLPQRAVVETAHNPYQFETPERLDSNQGPRSLGTIPVLQPRSPNKHILPRTSVPKDKRRRLEDRVQGARVFSEDGEDGTPLLGKRTLATTVTPIPSEKEVESARVSRNFRLTGLLEEPSPQRLLLSSSGNSILQDTPGNGTNSRENPRRTASSTHNLNQMNAAPLRARPVERLGLQDFKINPNYNQGYDYAFSDVVRGREQRKCLPGCTNPACCGDTFRRMAANLMRTRNGHPTPSQEQEDEDLLNNFLGANRGRLRTMAKEEREELVLQARARDLAKKHGKHRHAYERRPSPPGFWRSEFPSTQEEAADRAEADRVERGLVQQRYDEAMREGGAWLFRDE